MNQDIANKTHWKSFLGFEAYEKDPGFKQEILKVSRQGMVVIGLLGIIGIIAFVAAKSFFVNATIAWSYRDIDPETTIVLWDKLVMFMLSIACLALSRTEEGPRFGRILMAAMVVVFCVSSMLDDIVIGKGYTTTFLVLFMSSAVGTMPYRAWQTFLFGLLVIATITLCVQFLPLLADVPPLRLQKTVYVFLGIITIIYTGISGLLYSSRYEQFRARKKAEDFKQQLEVAHESLKGSYKKLSEAQDQLVQVQKIAAMGRVTAGIAHEIKNPLNFVNNFSELIEEQADDLKEELSPIKSHMSTEQVEIVDELVDNLKLNAGRILKHGERANQILAQMLDHTTVKERSVESVNLTRLIEKYVRLSHLNIQAEAPELNVEIEQSFASEMPELQVAPKEVGQVVMNLMSNAFDAIQQKTESANGSYQPMVQVSTHQLENHVEIRIQDNGTGVKNEIHQKIFEPFFTTSRRTGLGLSLAHEIITQRHQGELRVDSKEGHGATFTIVLPCAGVTVEE
ncbi:MAG: sensor histidine kinase [Rhodothermales bacterium]